ncbi:DUF6895 family protein [Deinococcus aquatilis]|uniref:DUF6895 family protein n=1 Tax=Deinococcus aquatilis TaxID=519440 RepID=UPI00037C7A76|nr:hypothetical protein [Deinococcus aquatilis]
MLPWLETAPLPRPASLPPAAGPGPVYQRALAWVLAHLECFDPRHSFVQDHQLRVKPFLELVFVLNPALRVGLDQQVPELRRLTQFIDATFANYDFAAFAHNDPAGLLLLALRDEYFGVTGRNTDDNDGLLARFVASGLHERVTRSRIPFRVMDLHYALDRAAGHCQPEAYLPLYAHTVLARGRGLTRCNTNDLYSITHTLFYLADLGQSPVAPLLGADAGRVHDLLRHALAMMLRQKNLDLAGEFIMCLSFFGETDSPLLKLAWAELAAQQLPGGAMPSPTYSAGRQAELVGDAAARYEFTQCYHTTLVMLGAATLGQPGSADGVGDQPLWRSPTLTGDLL